MEKEHWHKRSATFAYAEDSDALARDIASYVSDKRPFYLFHHGTVDLKPKGPGRDGNAWGLSLMNFGTSLEDQIATLARTSFHSPRRWTSLEVSVTEMVPLPAAARPKDYEFSAPFYHDSEEFTVEELTRVFPYLTLNNNIGNQVKVHFLDEFGVRYSEEVYPDLESTEKGLGEELKVLSDCKAEVSSVRVTVELLPRRLPTSRFERDFIV